MNKLETTALFLHAMIMNGQYKGTSEEMVSAAKSMTDELFKQYSGVEKK